MSRHPVSATDLGPVSEEFGTTRYNTDLCTMGAAVTHAIRVTVRSRFEPAHSEPRAGRYLFSYRITITNTGREAVQLQRRRWIIRDSLAASREVEGPGVVGETPILHAGEEFTYTSTCDLRSGFGRMDGTYAMMRLSDSSPFEVTVPTIHFQFPFAGN